MNTDKESCREKNGINTRHHERVELTVYFKVRHLRGFICAVKYSNARDHCSSAKGWNTF